MGVTERLARACASRPRRTLVCWGVAVLVAFALIATSLHGLSSQGTVIGKPDSTKAADAIAQAFPHQAAAAKGDVIVISSRRYTVGSPQFRAFAARGLAALRATGEVRAAHVAAVSPDRHAALVSLLIGSDSGAKSVEQVVEDASG